MKYYFLKDYIKNSYNNVSIKAYASKLKSVDTLDDASLDVTLSLPVNEIFDYTIKDVEYIESLNSLLKKMMKKNILKIKYVDRKSENRDYHEPIFGRNRGKKEVTVNVAKEGIIQDVVEYAHIVGHLMDVVLNIKYDNGKDSSDDAMFFHNLVPMLMEKIVLEKMNYPQLAKYYENLRSYRLKKFSDIDDALRELESFTSSSINEMLKENNINRKDFEDYLSEVELGFDPVYKAYCYHVSDGLSKKLFDRKDYKRDIKALVKYKNIIDLEIYLNKEVRR